MADNIYPSTRGRDNTTWNAPGEPRPVIVVTPTFLPVQNWATPPGTGTGGGPGTVIPQSTLNSTVSTPQERQGTIAAFGAYSRVAYGRQRLGSDLVRIFNYNNQAVFFIVWGVGPCDAIETLEIDNKPLPPGIVATHYLGTASQTVDPTLVAAYTQLGLTWTKALPGTCYSVITVPWSLLVTLSTFTAIGRWLKVYDPRLDSTQPGGNGPQRFNDSSTWVWSQNPTLHLADFLGNTRYGAKRLIDWQSVMVCANCNDELVGTEKRRMSDYVIDREAIVSDHIDVLRTAASCFVLDRGDTVTLAPDTRVTSLQLTVSIQGGGSCYWYHKIFLPNGYVQASGDQLMLDVLLPAGQTGNMVGGVEIDYQNAPFNLRGASAVDQNGLGNAFGDITPYANGVWYPRTFILPAALNGNTMLAVDLVCQNSTLGTYYAYYRNIRITDANGKIKMIIWQEGPPTANVVAYSALASGTVARPQSGAPGAALFSWANGDIIKLTQPKLRDPHNVPTVLEVIWTDMSQSPWRDNYAYAYAQGVLTGAVPWVRNSVRLPWITRYSQALREAIERFNKLGLNLQTWSIEVKEVGAQYELGDIITCTAVPFGILAQNARITRPPHRASLDSWIFDLETFNGNVYSDSVETAPTAAPTGLPDPTSPPTIGTITVVEEWYTVSQWTQSQTRLRVTWGRPVFPWIQSYYVRVTIGSTMVGEGYPTNEEFVYFPTTEGQTYTVAVQVISTVQQFRGPPSYGSITAGGSNLPPGDVQGFLGSCVGGQINLQWTALLGGVRGYKLRYGDPSTGTWLNSTFLDRVDAVSFRGKNIIAPGVYKFFIKAIGANESIESANAAVITLTVDRDTSAFLAGQYTFINPTLTNMTLDSVAGLSSWVTDMGNVMGFGHVDTNDTTGVFIDANIPLATSLLDPHDLATSQWLSEAWDIGLLVTGLWSAQIGVSTVTGSVTVTLELSPDGAATTYSVFPSLSANFPARYARIRVVGNTSATSFVVQPNPKVSCAVTTSSEPFGPLTSLASGPTIVSLVGHYAALTDANITPIGTTGLSSSIVRIEASRGRGIGSGFCLRFDPALTQSVTVPNSATNQLGDPSTIEVLFNCVPAAGNQTIWWKDNGSVQPAFGIYVVSHKLVFYVQNATSVYTVTTAQNVDDASWHRAGMGLSGGIMYAYLDGVFQGQVTVTGGITAPTGLMRLGGYNAGGASPLSGMVDDFLWFNFLRSQAAQQADMFLEISGATIGLNQYNKFNEGTGTSAADSTVNANNGTLINVPYWRPYDGFDVFLFNGAVQVANSFQGTAFGIRV